MSELIRCIKCDHIRQPGDFGPLEECPMCGAIYEKANAAKKELDKMIALAIRSGDWSKIDSSVLNIKLKTVPLTTGLEIPDKKIGTIVEIISAECAYGINIFRDIMANVTDFTGGRSRSSQKVLRDARKNVLAELRKEALYVGGDAVIAVDIDYSEMSGATNKLIMVAATGTAVKLKKDNDIVSS